MAPAAAEERAGVRRRTPKPRNVPSDSYVPAQLELVRFLDGRETAG